MMLPSLLWHPPLRKRNFIISITDNFAIKLIYKHLDHRKVSLKKKKTTTTTKMKCYLKNIVKRRRHSRYLQNNNNTQVEVDMHHDSVHFQ